MRPIRVLCLAAVQKELEQDLRASNAYAEKHGSFAELVREHYAAAIAAGKLE